MNLYMWGAVITCLVLVVLSYWGMKSDFQRHRVRLRVALFVGGSLMAYLVLFSLTIDDFMWLRIYFTLLSGYSFAFAVPSQLRQLNSQIRKKSDKGDPTHTG